MPGILPAGSGFLNWVKRFTTLHPVMSAAPLVAAPALIGARTGESPESKRRRALIGGGLGLAASMAIPGVRRSAWNFLRRQVHALTHYTPKSVKGGRLSPEVKRWAQLTEKQTPFSKYISGLGEKGLKLTPQEAYWLSLQSAKTLENPGAIAEALTQYRHGLSTLPGAVKALRAPTTWAKNWWRYTPTSQKLMIGGFGGLGVYTALKNREGGSGIAGSIGDALGWGLVPAAPIAVWAPLSWGFRKAMSGIGGLFDKQPGEVRVPQMPVGE